jgi:hypothetical protein
MEYKDKINIENALVDYKLNKLINIDKNQTSILMEYVNYYRRDIKKLIELNNNINQNTFSEIKEKYIVINTILDTLILFETNKKKEKKLPVKKTMFIPGEIVNK